MPALHEKELLPLSPRERFKKLLKTGIPIAGLILGIIATTLAYYASNYASLESERARLTRQRAAVSIAVASLQMTDQALVGVKESTDQLVQYTKRIDESARESFQNDLRNLDNRAAQAAVSSAKAINVLRSGFDISREQSTGSLTISPAYAEDSGGQNSGASIDFLRPYVMVGIILVITVFFFVLVYLFCTSSDLERVKFADNMMRTIVGFYIGIVTGLLGLPVH